MTNPSFNNPEYERELAKKCERPPRDGNSSDGLGMLSTNLRCEHGDAIYNDPPSPPCLHMYIEQYLDVKLVLDPTQQFARDHVLQDIQDFLENVYKAKSGYGVEFDVSDVNENSRRDDDTRCEVVISVEFWADAGYEGDETFGDWQKRVVANTPFWDVYNKYILFDHGQDELEETLRNTTPKESVT